MKRLSQSRSNNFCPELRKNALLISQSHFSNFALHMISHEISVHENDEKSFHHFHHFLLKMKCQMSQYTINCLKCYPLIYQTKISCKIEEGEGLLHACISSLVIVGDGF